MIREACLLLAGPLACAAAAPSMSTPRGPVRVPAEIAISAGEASGRTIAVTATFDWTEKMSPGEAVTVNLLVKLSTGSESKAATAIVPAPGRRSISSRISVPAGASGSIVARAQSHGVAFWGVEDVLFFRDTRYGLLMSDAGPMALRLQELERARSAGHISAAVYLKERDRIR